jgi:hypothetical protein
VKRVGSTHSLGLMAGFGDHNQVQLESEARNQRPPVGQWVLDEEQRDHLETLSMQDV